MNRPIHDIIADLRENNAKLKALTTELDYVRGLTLNEQQLGAKPEEMGTTGLINYVRGPHWPYVPESTCFHARYLAALEIIVARCGASVKPLFDKAIQAGRRTYETNH